MSICRNVILKPDSFQVKTKQIVNPACLYHLPFWRSGHKNFKMATILYDLLYINILLIELFKSSIDWSSCTLD